MTPARLRAAGDAAYTIEFDDRIDREVNDRAIDLSRRIEAAAAGVTDFVVGYRTVTVYFDPRTSPRSVLETTLRRLAGEVSATSRVTPRRVEVPVCYDPAFALDLDDIAAYAGCAADEVIARHLAASYRVYMVGFVPGFAYMAHVDARIAAPRKTTPRLKVPAGSVAIAAGQTGVYPAETPGGWNVIGRCPTRPFSTNRDEPFLFRPGDDVRFRAVSRDQYLAATEWDDR